MGMHWTERRGAVANLGRALEARGWKLWGWRPDRSDSSTDYYAPASWVGVATKAGAVACVDVNGYTVKTYSGHTERTHELEDAGECARCGGSGHDPDIKMTLEEARAEPLEYHRRYNAAHFQGRRTVSLTPTVVSPLQFTDDGWARCMACQGRGRLRRAVEVEGDTWPEFHPNPPRSVWHVERDGQILAKGIGLKGCHGVISVPEAAHVLARRMDAAIQPKVDADEVESGYRTTERGAVEVSFSARPSDQVLDILRGAGFRWHRQRRVWFHRATEQNVATARKASELANGEAA